MVSVRCCICWNGRFCGCERRPFVRPDGPPHLELLYNSRSAQRALRFKCEHRLVALQVLCVSLCLLLIFCVTYVETGEASTVGVERRIVELDELL
jgi:hypothetical protein